MTKHTRSLRCADSALGGNGANAATETRYELGGLMAGFGKGRPEKDFRGFVLSDDCWDGYHRPQSQRCVGWILTSKKNEDDIRCQCPCHDPESPRTKAKKPDTLPLPDAGTI